MPDAATHMRIDLLLCRLRFVKSRSLAHRWVEEGHIRVNGARVTHDHHCVRAGDILTLPIGNTVKVIALDSLPDRRGPAAEARAHYRDLTHGEQSP